VYDNNWNVSFPDSGLETDDTEQAAEISGNAGMPVAKDLTASGNGTVEHKQRSVVCNVL
jgi:hypothetical protein